jgi:hypothetical protein
MGFPPVESFTIRTRLASLNGMGERIKAHREVLGETVSGFWAEILLKNGDGHTRERQYLTLKWLSLKTKNTLDDFFC